jgi:hypothetical protein
MESLYMDLRNLGKKNKKEKLKLLSIRMEKKFIKKGVSHFSNGKTKYYKSHNEQFQHDWQIVDKENGGYRRMENMDDDYLKNKNNKNLQWKNKNTAEEIWGACEKDHMENGVGKEALKKANWKKTKPVLNFMMSWNSDLNLADEKSKKEHWDSVTKFIKNKFDHVIYVVQKNDEDGLHYSFSILNYDKTKHKSMARDLDVSWFSNLQDEFADQLKKDGQDYGFTRGIKYSNAKHRTLGESRKKVEKMEAKYKKLKDDHDELLDIMSMKEVLAIYSRIRSEIDDESSTKIDSIDKRFNDHYEAGSVEKAMKQVNAIRRVQKAQIRATSKNNKDQPSMT